MKLTKADVRRALVNFHFAPCENEAAAFDRLRSIQFDPIAPVGCNHDLVLQARVPDYRIDDWNKVAYEDRAVYDGWDKCASLIPYDGWPLRRLFYAAHRTWFEEKIFINHKDAVEAILREIEMRGPLLPKECEYQQRREEWKVSWFGPSVTKQTLRALWHSGLVMTSGRRKGQHIYDLTERVVPPHLFEQPIVPESDAVRELVHERHRAMGVVRPNAPYEVWSYTVLSPGRKDAIDSLVRENRLIPIEVEGVKAHMTPDFTRYFDDKTRERRAIILGPLDQFMWDRKMIAHLFDFDYIWEIYTPEVKRKWGYYVLPVLFGDALVARVEFWCRKGVLEVRQWHSEGPALEPQFWEAFGTTMRDFMRYCSAHEVRVQSHVDPKVSAFFTAMSR